MNQPKTAAQRKADERQRHKDAGLVAVTVWIRPDDRAKLAHLDNRLADVELVSWL